jgi:hypothetical protein
MAGDAPAEWEVGAGPVLEPLIRRIAIRALAGLVVFAADNEKVRAW